MLDVNKLYPQYNFVQDRRKQQMPVANDRRSGLDRRSGTRIKLDTNLTKDIFEVKNSVQQQSQNIKKPKVVSFTQKATEATQKATNSIVHKVANFVVENKKKLDVAKQTENLKVDAKHNADGMLIGSLATIFGGLIAAPFLGVAGVVTALGLGSLMGAKGLQNAIKNHLKK